MNRIATLLVSLTILGSTAAAQQPPAPKILSVPQRKSYQPGNVAILGKNLGVVTEVRVNGVSVPIVRITDTRLVAGPVAPQDPGFGTVQAVHGGGVVSATLPLLPTLTAQRQYTRMNVVLNNGDTGTYVLRHSYKILGTPEVDQNLYGKRYLPLFASTLTAGVFADANPLAINNILMPVQFGLIGSPLGVQAECYAATSGVTAYTNVVAVPGVGQHQ